jgi:ribosomal protein L3 glutamine methyltransferase
MRTLRDALTVAVRKLDAANLTYGHGTDNPLDEAVFLALEGLGLPIDKLEKHIDKKLTTAQLLRINQLVNLRITTRKPASYLVGRAYIQGIPFRVDERTIVPRSFIGELLYADHIVGPGAHFIPAPKKIKRVVDICTGSGCLAILAALKFPNALIDAVDLSKDALAVAKLNVSEKKLGKRVRFHKGNLFCPVKGKKYDLIITNPPYVDAPAMRALPPEYKHEPKLALAGGKDGLDLVRKILKDAPKHLTPDGAMICEIGTGREILEKEYPHLPFFWLSTENSDGEVFWLTSADLQRKPVPKPKLKKKKAKR